MEACSEQQGVNYEDTQDEAGASQAIQMLRAVKHKNFAVVMGKASKSGKKSGTPPPKQSSSTIDICCSSSPRRGEVDDRMEQPSSSFHQEGEEVGKHSTNVDVSLMCGGGVAPFSVTFFGEISLKKLKINLKN